MGRRVARESRRGGRELRQELRRRSLGLGLGGGGLGRVRQLRRAGLGPVSYTHLTLPTICSV
eukprot:6819547-Alexandrium_andersonii.AAC.1